MILTPSSLGLPDKFTSYRPNQFDTILDIAYGCSERRFDLLDAPTGSGKSAINYSLYRLLCRDNPRSRAIFLVSNKALQTQLLSDFGSGPDGLYPILGRRNYSSGKEYRAEVQRARSSKSVLTNYANWITLAKSGDTNRFGEFDLALMDEAHLVPDILVDQLSVEITNAEFANSAGSGSGRGKKLPPIETTTLAEWRTITSLLKADAEQYLSYLVSMRREDEQSQDEIAILCQHISDLSRFNSADLEVEQWIARQGSKPGTVKISPVWAKDYCSEYLFRGLPRIVLCSGTLPPYIADYYGINNLESESHIMQSSFDPNRRPFIYCPRLNSFTGKYIKVDFKMSEADRIAIISRFDEIIGPRIQLGWKGLIHSRSYALSEDIARRSKYRDNLLAHDSSSTAQALIQFRRSNSYKPLVLVSPAIEEGHDFPHDQARFQIVAKVPWLDNRNPLLKARAESDKAYSSRKVAESITQMAGRIVRDESDWGESHITDAHWGHFKRNNVNLFPKWFVAAWRDYSKVPEPQKFN